MRKDRSDARMPSRERIVRQSDKQETDLQKKRERFARAIARSEFGRHYWDERRETAPKHPRARK